MKYDKEVGILKTHQEILNMQKAIHDFSVAMSRSVGLKQALVRAERNSPKRNIFELINNKEDSPKLTIKIQSPYEIPKDNLVPLSEDEKVIIENLNKNVVEEKEVCPLAAAREVTKRFL